MDTITAFKILELPENADLEQVKAARRELIFIWHPDKHQANANAQKRALQKSKEINEAYEFLCGYLRNRSQSYSENEYTFIKCVNCGTNNRIQGQFRSGFKCGLCGAAILNPDNHYDQFDFKNERQPCGDGTCIGTLRENGRCGVCGRTWEEGKIYQRSREHVKSNTEQTYRSAYDEYETLVRKNNKSPIATIYEKFRRLSGFIQFCIIAFIIFGSLFALSEKKPEAPNKPTFSPQPSYSPQPPINISMPVSRRIETGYIDEFAQKRKSGHSQITIDNSRNDTDVIAKLFYLGGRKPYAVRVFSIRAGDMFTCENLSSGIYDLRYKVLASNQRYKTPEMKLEQYDTDDGIRYSRIELTLYKVPHGNMHTSPISENEFE